MNDSTVRLCGGIAAAFVAPAIFLVFCVLYFVVFKAFEMTALAMGGFVALLVGAMFSRNYARFWEHVMRGIGSDTSVAIIVILFMVGIISAMIKTAGVAGGFVWLAQSIGLDVGYYTFFVFLAVRVISMATGSSIGTMLTAFPIFYAAGIAMGAAPAPLAGAILSAAILGDNLAPISDTVALGERDRVVM